MNNSPKVSAVSYADWSSLVAANPAVSDVIEKSIQHGDICSVDLSQEKIEGDLKKNLNELTTDDQQSPAPSSVPPSSVPPSSVPVSPTRKKTF